MTDSATETTRPPLDPQIKALNDSVPGGLGLPMGDPVEARALFRALNVGVAESQPPADLAAVEDITVPGAEGPLRARVYRPHTEGPLATLVYFHGGGFVVGDIDAYDMQASTIAERTGAVVLSVDYRLAPDHRFPASVEDAESVMRWALANAARLGGDDGRVAVGGDSAGGNLAAVTAQSLRGELARPSAQLLIYPVLDFSNVYPSRAENANAPLLNEERMEWFNELYLPERVDKRDPRLSPLLTKNLTGLARTLIVTAGYDPLRDEGDLYAQSLTTAGVAVRHLRFESQIHGFFGLGPFSEGAAAAIDAVCVAAGELLAEPAGG